MGLFDNFFGNINRAINTANQAGRNSGHRRRRSNNSGNQQRRRNMDEVPTPRRRQQQTQPRRQQQQWRPAPRYTPPPRERTDQPRPRPRPAQTQQRNFSSGNNSGNTGGIRNTSSNITPVANTAPTNRVAAPIAPPAPRPVAPPRPPAPVMETVTIPDPLADADYKEQNAELARLMSDYSANQNLAKDQYEGSYLDGLRNLGWGADGFNKNGRQAYGKAYQANENDFAGRGMYHSGVYADEVGNLNSEFNDRKTSLDSSKRNFLDTQENSLETFRSGQVAARKRAEREAIARIVAELGIDPNQVSPGKTGSFRRERV